MIAAATDLDVFSALIAPHTFAGGEPDLGRPPPAPATTGYPCSEKMLTD
jgi:hypothetical protein